ncbi:MAG: YIP1 family protein, partial [Methylobacterium sp.]|nr:YIP1 family protein [Methylobacterium sp.]
MNPVTLFKLFFMPTRGWQDLLRTRPSVPRLFMLHVIPFSLIPSLMIYVAGMNNSIPLLQEMPSGNTLVVSVSFFVIQLIAVPIMASILRQLGEVADVHPSSRDSFILASVAPTPLWLAPVFLVVPSTTVILVVFT